MAQKHTNTRRNRYPVLFAAATEALRALRSPRILSFGCSTGEEMHSIRHYIPDADIFGCDVNSDLFDADAPGEVFLSTDANIRARAPFDLIFANSVLCYHPAKEVPSHFSFSEFKLLVTTLHHTLKPHGLLCLYNTSYPFSALPFADQYVSIPVRLRHNGPVPKWSPDGIAITERRKWGVFRLPPRIIRPDLLRAGDLMDCLYRKRQGSDALAMGALFDAA